MRIFKKLLPFLILVIGINTLLDLCFNSASYMRIALHELQSSEEDFEVVFVGQSHGANAFNPFIIEEKTGMPAYNLSNKLTAVRDISYLVKESNYKNDVDYVIYDIDSSYWLGFEEPNYFAEGYVFPHLNNPINKLDYFLNYSIKENFRYTLCRYVVYGTGDIKKIPENLKKRLSSGYLNYEMDSVLTKEEKTQYQGRGYFSVKKPLEVRFTPTEWRDDKVKEGVLLGFLDMVDYCKKNRIELICVSSPMPIERVEAENYPAFHEYFAKLAEENSIEFWDFNYIKDEYLVWNSEEFRDLDGHMLGILADKYSSILGEMLAQYKSGEDVEHYFEIHD